MLWNENTLKITDTFFIRFFLRFTSQCIVKLSNKSQLGSNYCAKHGQSSQLVVLLTSELINLWFQKEFFHQKIILKRLLVFF